MRKDSNRMYLSRSKPSAVSGAALRGCGLPLGTGFAEKMRFISFHHVLVLCPGVVPSMIQKQLQHSKINDIKCKRKFRIRNSSTRIGTIYYTEISHQMSDRVIREEQFSN